MPLSTDNQDYGKSDDKDKSNQQPKGDKTAELTTDDLKGKKVDADPSKEKDKPAPQQ